MAKHLADGGFFDIGDVYIPAVVSGMKIARSERMALAALVLILVGLPATALGYQFGLRPILADVRTIDIVAAAPEMGGFQPDNIRIAVGERVRLRFSVPDVTHGLAIGPGLEDMDLGQLDPGEVKTVEVTFERPGRYTLYCNTWCSPNHWRMRGIIEVYDPEGASDFISTAGKETDPVFESLAARGEDIDAPHEVQFGPDGQPSAARGATVVSTLQTELPPAVTDAGWRRSHSPAEAWMLLKETGLGERDAWDAVTYLWLQGLDATELATAKNLYAKNCAACHGETGDGEGPGADALAAQDLGRDASMPMAGEPTAFADPYSMLGGTSDVYYAKLRRGGMGTGMPGFGPIFTREETWMLVDYLWTFVLGNQ